MNIPDNLIHGTFIAEQSVYCGILWNIKTKIKLMKPHVYSILPVSVKPNYMLTTILPLP